MHRLTTTFTLYERRKEESWKYPALNYSLTYRRLLELEVRLLEKEWIGEGSEPLMP